MQMNIETTNHSEFYFLCASEFYKKLENIVLEEYGSKF